MSIGSQPLGTLLVQRLDAVLGTTLSQQTNIVSGARPDAVSQPDNPNRPDAGQNETLRHPRESVDRATAQTEQQGRQAINKATLDARHPNPGLLRNPANTSSTPSAPTTLGFAAKTILALLASFPDQAPPVAGKAPLSGAPPNAPSSTTSAIGAAGTSSSGAATPASPMAGAHGAEQAEASEASRAPGAAAGVKGAGLPSLNATAPAFAQALTQALQGSGLFYESHLNDLAFGKQRVNSLQQEPQAKLSGAAKTAGDTPAAGTPKTQNAPVHVENVPQPGNPHARPEAGNAPQSPGPAQQAGVQSQAQAGALAGLHPETHLLVRQQLEVLANQAFVWRGEAWPNAPMRWEVDRREHPGEDPHAAVQDHWATRITITMPNLGEVQARINLVGQHLILHVLAPQSARRLNEHSETLRSRYLASGLQLGQLSIDGMAPRDNEAPS